jgi:hypothetical protein
MCMVNYKKSQFDLFKKSLAINNNTNVNKCWFLLSSTQLSIWSNKFLGKAFGPIIWSGVHNLHMQCNSPYNIHAKNEFCKGCSNNDFDSKIGAASKVHNSRNKDPIVKLGSFGHNSLKYCAYFSSPWRFLAHSTLGVKGRAGALKSD